MRKNKLKRLGVISLVEYEDAKKERRNRTIDLSKYTMGFEQVTNTKSRPPAPSQNKAQGVQYEKYLAKFEKGDLSSFSTRDIMFFFRDIANDNGAKYIIANPKIDMRNFKLALERGYTTEELLAMIEFLFTSGQTYLEKRNIHPGILLTGWCNKIYQDTQLWLDDKYNPNEDYKKNRPTREWTDNNEEVKSNVGEWE